MFAPSRRGQTSRRYFLFIVYPACPFGLGLIGVPRVGYASISCSLCIVNDCVGRFIHDYIPWVVQCGQLHAEAYDNIRLIFGYNIVSRPPCSFTLPSLGRRFLPGVRFLFLYIGFLCQCKNILGRIDVSIMTCTAFRTRPIADGTVLDRRAVHRRADTA